MRSPTDPDRGPRRRSRGTCPLTSTSYGRWYRRAGHPVAAVADTAMEMTRPWTSQNDVHRRLEISHRTRDSHIPTAASCLRRMKNDEENDNTPYRWTPALE
jgi:hypothetical protein